MPKHRLARWLCPTLVLGLACTAAVTEDPSDPPPESLEPRADIKGASVRGGFHAVAAKGGYLYLADGSIHVYQVGDGTNPTEVFTLPAQEVTHLTVRGDLLYFRDNEGQHIADISDPSTIKPLSLVTDDEFGGFVHSSIAASAAQVVVATTGVGPANEVVLFDLKNPRNPEQVSRFFAGGAVTSLAIERDTLYVAMDTLPDGFVEVWDVSDWDAPARLGVVRGACGKLFYAQKGVLFCGLGGPQPAGRYVLDAREPTNPALLAPESADGGAPEQLWFGVRVFLRVGSYLYVQPYMGQAYPLDIKDPLHPVLRRFTGNLQLGGPYNTTNGMTVDERFVYTSHDDGASIFERSPKKEQR
jgi:hypothetical protein